MTKECLALTKPKTTNPKCYRKMNREKMLSDTHYTWHKVNEISRLLSIFKWIHQVANPPYIYIYRRKLQAYKASGLSPMLVTLGSYCLLGRNLTSWALSLNGNIISDPQFKQCDSMLATTQQISTLANIKPRS